MDVIELFESMTADERSEFLNLLLDEYKQQGNVYALLEISRAATNAAMSQVPSTALPAPSYEKKSLGDLFRQADSIGNKYQ